MTNHSEKTPAELVGEKKSDNSVREDVAKDLAKEALEQEARLSTGNETDDVTLTKWHGADEIAQYSHLIEGGIAALEKAIDKKDGIPEEKVAGLLILERNGQNRTEYVRLLKKRLGIKDLAKELPQAGGPDYTNDVTKVTDL